MMTRGSTKAVAVSSPSSKQARTYGVRLVSWGDAVGQGLLTVSFIPWVCCLLLWERYPWGALGLERAALRPWLICR